MAGSSGFAAALRYAVSIFNVEQRSHSYGGKRALRTWFSVAFWVGVEEKERKGVDGLMKADFATG